MAKRKSESNGVYILKIVLYFILGTIWIRFSSGDGIGLGVPVGLLFGLILASHEHFQIDKKMEYAILIISAILSFSVPIGATLLI